MAQKLMDRRFECEEDISDASFVQASTVRLSTFISIICSKMRCDEMIHFLPVVPTSVRGITNYKLTNCHPFSQREHRLLI